MMGYGSGLGLLGMSFGWIFMLLFWGAILWGVVSIIVWLTKTESEKGNGTALEILKARYAKGEISKAEFETKRSDLRT